jgi:hypothetical protein
MAADQPGIRSVPPDLYEWDAHKRRRYELLAMLLICGLFALFVGASLTVGAHFRG